MKNILEVITDRPIYVAYVNAESEVHSEPLTQNGRPVYLFQPDDYCVVQTIAGEKLRFDFKDSGECYPGTDCVAFPGENFICWKAPDGKVHWSHSAPWMEDSCTKVVEVVAIDTQRRTITTLQGEEFTVSYAVSDETLLDEAKGLNPYMRDYYEIAKIAEGVAVALIRMYINRGDKDDKKRISVYKKLGIELKE